MCSQDIEQKPNYDGRNDGRNDGQPKSSIAPLFRSGAIKISFCAVVNVHVDVGADICSVDCNPSIDPTLVLL